MTASELESPRERRNRYKDRGHSASMAAMLWLTNSIVRPPPHLRHFPRHFLKLRVANANTSSTTRISVQDALQQPTLAAHIP
jgi:hypothetical protein